VAVTAASRALTRLLEADAAAIDVLADLDRRQPVDDLTPDALVRWKQHELLRIAARDLSGHDDLEAVGANLAALAADVLDGACRIANTEGLAVIGMGKLGGDELNYASDIDVMFVGDGAREALVKQARAVLEISRRCFRVDANLRPEGRDGPLVRSLESYEAYWDRWAAPWEFQALLKARPKAGSSLLGSRFLDTAQRWLWSRPFRADDLRSLREMKARAEAEVARKGLGDRELKRGRGGIRDIEFTVQLLQLVHGRADSLLRSPTTLDALGELASAGYVDDGDAAELADAYRFLRTVEHRLQLVDEQQTHTIPDSAPEREWLARVLGHRDTPRGRAVELFDRQLRRQQNTVRGIHERVYFRPLLEAFAGAETDAELSPEAAVARLEAFGFTDAKRTQAAVRELTRGLNRTSRLMQQLLPLLLDWLSAAPDPDLGLLMLRNQLSGEARQAQLAEVFRDAPDAARQLCALLGTSRLLGDALAHNPDLVARLNDPARLATAPRAELVEGAVDAIAWRADREARQDGLRRWKERHWLGIAARDVLGHAEVSTVGADLTTLAEASLDAALAILEPKVPFAVIALGRFGGGELSYASDLDVVFTYDGRGAAAAEEGLRVATGLKRFLDGTTPANRIYDIDPDLRPEGKQGAMARSLDAFVQYWEGYALAWERMAMSRARPVAGDLPLGARLIERLEPFVWGDGLSTEEVREIRRIKARVERERIPAGEDPTFHLKLGRGSLSDVEFTIQLLQLRHSVRAIGTRRGLAALVDAGALDEGEAEILGAAYRFCERTRDRWYLVNSGPSDSLPTQPEPLLWLARSLDTTPGQLREHYRRVTRRARKVVERRFYGQA
jgi:glutamate-ammonia-ligase adenylyltransferase